MARDKDLRKAYRVAKAGGLLPLRKHAHPTKRSRTSLWQELNSARVFFEVGKRFRRSQQSESRKKFKEIESAAKGLGELLRDYDVFLFKTDQYSGGSDIPSISAPLVQEVLKTVAELAAKGQTQLNVDHPLAKGFGLYRWSAFDHLVGRLAIIYEKYSDQKVKFKRKVIDGDSQSLEGKFVSFASKALEELQVVTNDGKPYSPETVGRAYSHVKAGKPRSAQRKKSIG